MADFSLLSHIFGTDWSAMGPSAHIVFRTEGEPERLDALTPLLILLVAVIGEPVLLSLDRSWLVAAVSRILETLRTLLHASIIY